MPPDDTPSPGTKRPDDSDDLLDDILGGLFNTATGASGAGKEAKNSLGAAEEGIASRSGTASPQGKSRGSVAEKAAAGNADEPAPDAQSAAPVMDGVYGPAVAKVKLDIDDAPFLDEEPAPPPPEAPAPPALKEQEAPPQAPAGFRAFFARLPRKKRLLMAAGAVVLFVLTAPALYVLFSGKQAPPLPAVPEQELPAARESEKTPPDKQVFVYEGAPYLVEHRGSEGEILFLRVRYTLTTENLDLIHELRQKRLGLRDAVYHYLSNKSLDFFRDSRQIDSLRDDLTSIINEHLTVDKIKELYFEEYSVTGASM